MADLHYNSYNPGHKFVRHSVTISLDIDGNHIQGEILYIRDFAGQKELDNLDQILLNAIEIAYPNKTSHKESIEIIDAAQDSTPYTAAFNGKDMLEVDIILQLNETVRLGMVSGYESRESCVPYVMVCNDPISKDYFKNNFDVKHYIFEEAIWNKAMSLIKDTLCHYVSFFS